MNSTYVSVGFGGGGAGGDGNGGGGGIRKPKKCSNCLCQYVGTPIHNFCAASFALRQTTGFCGLIYALEQPGVHITKDQLAVIDVIEWRADYGKE